MLIPKAAVAGAQLNIKGNAKGGGVIVRYAVLWDIINRLVPD
jgi:hypothetical protein